MIRVAVVGMFAKFIFLLGVLFAIQANAQSRSVNVGDAVINYEITGSGETLVLTYGTMLCARSFSAFSSR